MSERVVITGPGEYWTRDGRRATVYAYLPLTKVWVGEVKYPGLRSWKPDGLFDWYNKKISHLDLVGPASEPYPEPVEVLALAGGEFVEPLEV